MIAFLHGHHYFQSNVLQFLEEYTMDFDDIMREPHWLFPFTLKVKVILKVNANSKLISLRFDLNFLST